MIDFYLIDDGLKTSESPDDLEFVGGLSLKEFKDIQNKEIIFSKESYFSDFRWNLKTVELKLKSNLLLTIDINLVKFVEILNQAAKSNCGIIAFCD